MDVSFDSGQHNRADISAFLQMERTTDGEVAGVDQTSHKRDDSNLVWNEYRTPK